MTEKFETHCQEYDVKTEEENGNANDW